LRISSGDHAIASALHILSSSDIEKIHHATLRILDEIGIVLTHPKAREFFAAAGARLAGEKIHIPPDLVESCLALCPRHVSLRGRGGQTAILGDGSLHWHNLGGARDLYDPLTNQCRPANVKDVGASARLLDALSSVTTVTPLFTPQDVPGEIIALAMYRYCLAHTSKPVHGPGLQTAQEVRYLARMAEIIGQPSEVLTLGVSPISPLTFPESITAAIMETARLGIPIGPLPCPTAGATAPLSLAGALAQQNAEVLASIILAQLIHPGLPVFYCGRLAMIEPRLGGSVWGGVELGLASAATVQLAHHYGLPANVYGLSTNAHDLGLQSGFERAINALVPALAGADELSGIGEMSAGVMGSYAQMVVDNEIAASIQRLRRGFSVDSESLAVEVISAVMDGAHNFLSEPHTVRYLRAGELQLTHLAERRGWDEWKRSDQIGMVERAQAEAEKLLAEHQVDPLSETQERELDEILVEAQAELS